MGQEDIQNYVKSAKQCILLFFRTPTNSGSILILITGSEFMETRVLGGSREAKV